MKMCMFFQSSFNARWLRHGRKTLEVREIGPYCKSYIYKVPLIVGEQAIPIPHHPWIAAEWLGNEGNTWQNPWHPRSDDNVGVRAFAVPHGSNMLPTRPLEIQQKQPFSHLAGSSDKWKVGSKRIRWKMFHSLSGLAWVSKCTNTWLDLSKKTPITSWHPKILTPWKWTFWTPKVMEVFMVHMIFLLKIGRWFSGDSQLFRAFRACTKVHSGEHGPNELTGHNEDNDNDHLRPGPNKNHRDPLG